jgi:hypothetical protein
MKKSRILVLALAAFLLVGAFSASAQVRLDVDIPWILTAGANVSSITGSQSTNFDLSGYTFPLPYLELAYQFGLDPFAIGVGVRSYTLIVAFAGWPMVYVEANLKPIVLRAELGGFAFFTLGALGNNLFINEYTMRVMLPDFQASFAFTDWFRAGAGVILVAPVGNFNNFGWMGYINARFCLLFK